MAINLNDNIKINASKPIDTRLVSTESELDNISNKYEGMIVVVTDTHEVMVYFENNFVNLNEILSITRTALINLLQLENFTENINFKGITAFGGEFKILNEDSVILKAPQVKGEIGQVLALGYDRQTLEWSNADGVAINMNYNDVLADLTTLQSSVRRAAESRNPTYFITTNTFNNIFEKDIPFIKIDISTARNLFLYCNPKLILQRYSRFGTGRAYDSGRNKVNVYRSSGFKVEKLSLNNEYNRVNEFDVSANSTVVDILPERYLKLQEIHNTSNDTYSYRLNQIGARYRAVSHAPITPTSGFTILFRFMLQLTINDKIVEINLNQFYVDYKKSDGQDTNDNKFRMNIRNKHT